MIAGRRPPLGSDFRPRSAAQVRYNAELLEDHLWRIIAQQFMASAWCWPGPTVWAWFENAVSGLGRQNL